MCSLISPWFKCMFHNDTLGDPRGFSLFPFQNSVCSLRFSESLLSFFWCLHITPDPSSKLCSSYSLQDLFLPQEMWFTRAGQVTAPADAIQPQGACALHFALTQDLVSAFPFSLLLIISNSLLSQRNICALGVWHCIAYFNEVIKPILALSASGNSFFC